jgi:hypothetical protein
MSNELNKTESADPLSILLKDPVALSGFPVDVLERLVALHAKAQADLARKEFSAAMNRVQSRLRPVQRTASNTQTGSLYATAEAIERMLLPILHDEGFSVSQSTEDPKIPAHLRVALIVRHVGGHEERHYLDAPVDTVGLKGNANKTPLHGMGSTLTYCKRYLLCMVFGVQLVKDDDGSGGASGPGAEKITDNQALDLRGLMQEVKADEKRFLAVFEVQKIEDLPAACLKPALRMLEAKRR